jgi:hypothetical protein
MPTLKEKLILQRNTYHSLKRYQEAIKVTNSDKHVYCGNLALETTKSEFQNRAGIKLRRIYRHPLRGSTMIGSQTL